MLLYLRAGQPARCWRRRRGPPETRRARAGDRGESGERQTRPRVFGLASTAQKQPWCSERAASFPRLSGEAGERRGGAATDSGAMLSAAFKRRYQGTLFRDAQFCSQVPLVLDRELGDCYTKILEGSCSWETAQTPSELTGPCGYAYGTRTMTIDYHQGAIERATRACETTVHANGRPCRCVQRSTMTSPLHLYTCKLGFTALYLSSALRDSRPCHIRILLLAHVRNLESRFLCAPRRCTR